MPDAADLIAHFGPERLRRAVPLARFTTFKAGGPAEWFLETRGADETVRALQVAARAGIPVVILGGGSNVLIGDKGIRGLVIRPRGAQIESPSDGLVRAEAGVTVNGLVRWTINHGLAGLERWAGTPGTIGGGIAGNAHFGGRLLGDLVDTVRIATLDGRVMDLRQDEMEFGYDRSRLLRTREVLLWASFRVGRGEPAELRARARVSLAHRKQTQPLDVPSAGCIFQNPSEAAGRSSDMAAAGALVDRAGKKGRRIGGACVSTTHANFIVNEGGASARDIRTLIDECRFAVKEQFGIELQEEIVYLGEF
ncbi:MAG: UDP-N-acetylmuramate dehydrogenase [Vicinamibacterales bacterium]